MGQYDSSTVLPPVLTKVSDFLYDRTTQKTNVNSSVSSTVQKQDKPVSRQYGTIESYYKKDGKNLFDFKYEDTGYGGDDFITCKSAYDKWIKSDDYIKTKKTYEELTAKQKACDGTINKIKNWFGKGQRWTESDEKNLQSTISHIETMTSRGGIGQ